MWSYFNILDALLALYFLFWFPYQPVGYLLAFLFMWRIMRDFMSGRDEIVLDFKPKRKRVAPGRVTPHRTILKRGGPRTRHG